MVRLVSAKLRVEWKRKESKVQVVEKEGSERTLHLPDQQLTVQPICPSENQEFGGTAGEELVAQTGEPA
jgi:hypothetical protein